MTAIGVAGATILVSGLVYALAYALNEHLLAFTHYAQGVNWIYLPSGLRLTLVLVFGVPAALGIAGSTMLISTWTHDPTQWIEPVVTGLISGLAPWAALVASRRWLRLGRDLSGLRTSSLLALAVLFAVVSAGLHQVWYSWTQPPQDNLTNFVVMAAGDLVGTLIVLYLCKWALSRLSPTA